MDGKGRWMDNVFIERLWRSLKYECIYLHEFETGTEARMGIGMQRPHSALAGLTPDEWQRAASPETPCPLPCLRWQSWQAPARHPTGRRQGLASNGFFLWLGVTTLPQFQSLLCTTTLSPSSRWS
jgi:hypothetical protein